MTWVLVTGATTGIGRDATLRLARAGTRNIATGRDEGRLAQLAAEARGAGLSVPTVPLDVCDPVSVERARARVAEITGGHGIDVLINNAGRGTMGPLDSFDPADLRATFETNVVGLARVTRAFLPAMRERRRGRVVNVSSVLGRMTLPAHGPYCASKHAVEALSDALRREMEPFGVSVTVIEPGAIATNFREGSLAGLDRTTPDWAGVAARVRRAASRVSPAPPEVVSRALFEALVTRSPPARRAVPRLARAQVAAARLVPRGLYEAAMRAALVGSMAPRPAHAGGPRLALVTGAAGGIGGAVTRSLAKRGFRVLATDVNEDGLARLARDAREARLPIEARTMDVTDEASIERAAAHVERTSGGRGLDVLINNAGYAELGPIELVSDAAWGAQLAVNVYGPCAVVRAFAPAMRRAGRGRIVNLSSVAGVVSFPFMGAYCASKFALESLTDALRIELGAFGVGVSAVRPSFIRSGFSDRARETVAQYALEDGPYAPVAGRMDAIAARLEAMGGEPDDVARAVVEAVLAPAPRARYHAPFGARVAAEVLSRAPAAIADRAIALGFETRRLGRGSQLR